MFTVNVLATTYFLGWGNPDPKVVLELCVVSQIGWKVRSYTHNAAILDAKSGVIIHELISVVCL
jgi:hypothetical protein